MFIMTVLLCPLAARCPGDIIVAERDRHALVIFDADGTFKRCLFEADGIGAYPCALAAAEGLLYVMDQFSQVLVVLD